MAEKVLFGSDSLIKRLEEIAKKMGGGAVEVGFMANAKYPDGTSVAQVAFMNEFGTSKIPARPFFRPMISGEQSSWPEKMAGLAKATDYDGKKVLSMMGEDISGALDKSIKGVTSPALSPVTLMLRKMVGNQTHLITGKMVGEAAERVKKGEQGATGTHAKPLIWTNQMVNSITYRVTD